MDQLTRLNAQLDDLIQFGMADKIIRGLAGEDTRGLSLRQVGGALSAASGIGALVGGVRAKKRNKSVLGGAIKGGIGVF